jgi:2-dehydro-3-deoxyphosphooctonate aldolase (KDO 8-P synthase)
MSTRPSVQRILDWLPTSLPASITPAPFFLMAGPCAIEDEQTPLLVADHVSQLCRARGIPYIFKSSYRKANRTREDSFTGIGDKQGLTILKAIREQYQVPVVTDIHESHEAAEAAEAADVLQIPAFLCRQTELLHAAGATGRVVNVKKGQMVGVDAMKYAAEKIIKGGSDKVILTERGNSFGYTDLIVDFRNFPALQAYGWPVVYDVTHSLQEPNRASGVTGGRPELIGMMAAAAAAAGVDGFFIETHPEPAKAKSDGANMLRLDLLEGVLDKLLRVAEAVRL